MLTDGVKLVEGSSFVNATIASGSAFPGNASPGELFFRTDTGKLNYFGTSQWIELGSSTSLLNGQPGTYYLDLANATGTLAVQRGGTGTSSLETLKLNLGLAGFQPLDDDLTAIADLSGATGLLRKTAANTWALDLASYLTTNQNISVTGDATGSGTTAIPVTLASVGTPGTYKSVTTDAKGRVTAGTNPTTLAGYGITDALKNTDSTFTGTLTMVGDIEPSDNITYNLGSPTKMWKDIYVGPGSIYMNGVKILEQVASTVIFSSDVNQNVRIETSGTGNLELQAEAGGSIQMKGTLSISSGKRIVDSAGIQVEFADNIEMTGNKVTGLAAPVVGTDAANKAYVDGVTSADATLVRTTGDQSIGGNKTFTGNTTIAGNLTISGTTTTVNSQTILLADNILELNSDFTTGVPSEDSGIQIRRGDLGTAKFIWDESNDRFTAISGAGASLPLYIGSTLTAASIVGPLTGNASSATVLETPRTINGASFNGSANISFTTDAVAEGSSNLYFTNARAVAAAPVQSFNTRTGAISLTSTDVSNALGFVPISSTGATTFTGNVTAPLFIGGLSGTASKAISIVSSDTRASQTGPQTGAAQVLFDFKNNSTDGLGDGGTYHGVMTFQSYADQSGGGTRQLGFTDANNLWIRGSGSSLTAYGAWKRIIDDASIGGYAPSLSGVGAIGLWNINVIGAAGSVAITTDDGFTGAEYLTLNRGGSTGAVQYNTSKAYFVPSSGIMYSQTGFRSGENANGKTLFVGNTPSASATQASIAVTNGNVHIDSTTGAASGVLINYYGGTGGVVFGNGASGTNANVSAGGVFTGTNFIGAGTGLTGTAASLTAGRATSTASLDNHIDADRSAADVNTMRTNGTYGFDNLPANAPAGSSYTAMVVARNTDTGLQITGGHNTDSLWFRGWSGSGSSFTPWRTVIHTGNISAQVVASATSATKLTGPAATNGTDGWFRSSGDTGWYNTTHGTGIYSDGGATIRTYNSSRFITNQGTAALPAISFSNSTDTGIYSENAGNLNFSTNGVYRGKFDASGNLNITGNFNGSGSGLTGLAASLTSGSTSGLNSAALASAYTWTAAQYFRSNKGASSYLGANLEYTLQAYSTDLGAAAMTFHRASGYAVNLGLDPDNVFRLGGYSASANRMSIDMSGNLTMAGDITAFSDERLKNNWADLDEDFVSRWAQVKHGTYDRIDSGERQVGLSAQAVQAILPNAVSENNEGTLSLNYGSAAAVASVQLAKKVVSLEEKVAQLEAMIQTLMAKG